jgi:hypothetical protein
VEDSSPNRLSTKYLAAIASLRRRFVDELPLWRLSLAQFLLLAFWAAWPLLSAWLFPRKDLLALAPVFIFLPFVYIVGYPLLMALPGTSGVPMQVMHPFALSTTIFVLAYLGLVSWRQGRKRRTRAADMVAWTVLVALIAVFFVMALWKPAG